MKNSYRWDLPKLRASLIQLQQLAKYVQAMVEGGFHVGLAERVLPLVQACLLIAEYEVDNEFGNPGAQVSELVANAFSQTQLKVFQNKRLVNPTRFRACELEVATFNDPEVLLMLPVPPSVESNLKATLELFTTLGSFQRVFAEVSAQTMGRFATIGVAAESVEMLLAVACKMTCDEMSQVAMMHSYQYIADNATKALINFEIQVK